MRLFTKIFFLLPLLIPTFNSIKAQANLVENPGFEDLYSNPNSCPDGQLYLAKHWNRRDSALVQSGVPYCPAALASAFFTIPACATPYNWAGTGYQYPRSGNNMAGAYGYTADTVSTYPERRMYLHGLLSQTLQVGKVYCVTYFVNLYNAPHAYAVSKFGLYIDNGQIDTVQGCTGIFSVTPQIENTAYPLLDDTLNWMKIQGTYTANGTETNITIGNFVTDNQSNVTQVYNGNFYTDAFYNIDDISIIPIDLSVSAGKDTSITLGDSVFIGRPNEIGLNDDCTWYVLGNSTAFDTVAGLWIKPNTLGTHSYVVEQNICGTISYDTVVVAVNPVGIEKYKNQNSLVKLYPNPTNNIFYVTGFDVKQSQLPVEVKDVTGKLVYKATLQTENGIAKIDCILQPGVYVVTLTNGGIPVVKKIIVQ